MRGDLMPGSENVFVSVIENAQQTDEKTRGARSPRFAEQGSLQLQRPKNVVRGVLRSNISNGGLTFGPPLDSKTKGKRKTIK